MFRIGNGYDVHRLVEGRILFLGGVEIPYQLGLLGHSDADVLIHALVDALLGAVAMGDIGRLFPDTDMKYKDMQSEIFLKEAARIVKEKNYQVSNIDITVIAQKPKLSPYIEQMRENISDILKVEKSRVSIKATTQEGLGFAGRGEGIAALATVLLQKESHT
jgi:2-C-methyl-D-erythritol 2,4-cyclodiphosphate synthase